MAVDGLEGNPDDVYHMGYGMVSSAGSNSSPFLCFHLVLIELGEERILNCTYIFAFVFHQLYKD